MKTLISSKNIIISLLMIVVFGAIALFFYFDFITSHAYKKMSKEYINNTFIRQEYNGILMKKEFFGSEHVTISIKKNDSSIVVYKLDVEDNRSFIGNTNINDSVIKVKNNDSIRVISNNTNKEVSYKFVPLSGSN